MLGPEIVFQNIPFVMLSNCQMCVQRAVHCSGGDQSTASNFHTALAFFDLIDFYFTDPPEANRCLSKGVSCTACARDAVHVIMPCAYAHVHDRLIIIIIILLVRVGINLHKAGI